ncbi:MAG: hypothetical protein IH595_04580 [Bacteroidales bacterium]|nr:hypothetical protein [Bacteroidales bacterium]
MKLTRENYGIFIIDYFDGNLSEAEKEQLLLFLDANPDLKKEFTDLRKVTLSKPDVTFPDKEKLKVPAIQSAGQIDKDNYESFFILYHDGELKEGEDKELKLFLDKNPHLLKELELFGKIRLDKDKKVVFRDKAALKHKKPVTIQMAFVIAVAAMLLIYFGFRFLTPGKNEIHAPRQYTRMAALEVMPAMTLSLTVSSDASIRLKSQTKTEVPKTRPIIIQQIPVGMMASLDAPVHFDNSKADASLYTARNSRNTSAQPHPVVVEEVHNSLFADAVTRRIDKLAGLFAKHKREKMESNEHDKPFVQILENGVKTFNFLTNNDVVFVKTYNSKGSLTGYQLLSDNLQIDKNIHPVSNGD